MLRKTPSLSNVVHAVQQRAKPGSASISTRSALVGGALLFGGTAYFSYRYSNAHAVLPTPDPDAPIDPAAGFRVFDAIADKYDEAIGQEEAALWYGTMRKWLLKQASGDVLEISYYDLSESSGVRSLTCTDLSQHMLFRAEDKFFDELQLGMKYPHVKVNFVLADAHCLVDPNAKAPEPPPKPKPQPPAPGKTVIPGLPAGAVAAGDCGCSHAHPEGKEWQYVQRCATGQLEGGAKLSRFAPGQFDTVVDTFGLCSHEDPVQVLKEMARVCKPGGRILLLQHGRSHYQWLNDKLDGSAVDHQRKWGCLWNRDILDIVQQAGLVVDKSTRWHFGTSYYIVAYPPVQR
eukprot:XP_001696967.1 predicted protein [Chlamydomonas reinhardtii]